MNKIIALPVQNQMDTQTIQDNDMPLESLFDYMNDDAIYLVCV
jgi:hypothetical protein